MLTNKWKEFEVYLLTEASQSKSSMPRFSSAFRVLCRWFDERSLDFNRDNFNQFVYYLQSTPQKDGSNYSPHYLNNFLKLAKHLDRYLKTNHLEGYKHFVSDKDTVLPQDLLTPDDIKKLASVKVKYGRFRKQKNLKMRTLILFLGIVGSRIGETLALQRAWVQDGEDPLVYFPKHITKSKRERWCVVPRTLHTLLMELPENDDGTLFGIYDKSGINDDLKRRAELCGIKKRVFNHLFRYSSINNKLAAGIPLEVVTAYHGHTTTEITYKHYVRLQMQKAADIFYASDPFFVSELNFELISKKSIGSVEKLLEKKDFKKTVDTINSRKVTRVLYIEGKRTFEVISSEPV